MAHGRVLIPTLSSGVLAAAVLVAPAQAAAPQPQMDVATRAFTPTLTYVTCPSGEELPRGTRCATLTVPLDWQTPDDGRTTQIALRVKLSKQRGGALTVNPGGPGESGIALTGPLYSLLPEPVRDRFDFVTWDPRGVGLSGPALTDCEPGAVAYPNETGPVDWQEFWEGALATTGAANAACLAANQDAAPYLGTWQVIRDLEAMRIALDYKQWNYWGMSYGTRIGHAYARTFPTSLRALIMDGSVMAQETLFRFGTKYPAGLQVSQQVYASVTRKSQAHKINVIFDYLDNAVIPVQGGDLTRWGFAAILKDHLTQQARYSALRDIVNPVYDFIQAQSPAARARAGRTVREVWARVPRVNDPAVTLALINCSDLHDRPTAEQLAAASVTAERQYGAATVMWMFNAALCAGLPADLSPASPTGTQTISLANPPMFVLSTGDAATPWIWGRSMANTFARSRTISYSSTQHVTYLLTPSKCVNSPVTRYLLTLELPSKGISCGFAPSTVPAPA